MAASLTTFDRSHSDLALADLWPIYRRRRRIFYLVLGGCLALAALYAVVSTRRYEAKGVVQVQRQSPDGLGLESLSGGQSNVADALTFNMDLETQASILQSDSLALKVIQDLNLENTKDFKSHFNPIGWALGLFSPGGTPDPKGASLENSPARRAHVLKVFSSRLKVKVDSGTRLIDITYRNPDPKLAAAVVNHLIEDLRNYNFQTRSIATTQVSNWLSGQLGDLRKQSEDLQAKVISLQRDMGVISVGNTDAQGKQEVYSSSLDRLRQATAALSDAESNRILKGAVYQAAKTGDADLLSGLSGNAMGAASLGVNNSLALIQTLRAQQSTLQQQISRDEAKFDSAYPPLIEERASLNGINQSIQAEIQRIGERAKNDYLVSQQAEQNTKNLYEEARGQASGMNDKAVEFTIARQEAENSRTLYDDLLRRLKEAGVLEGLRSSNITIVDPGRAPFKPSSPNIPLALAVALAIGLLGAAGTALFLDTVDNKIQTPDEIERQKGFSLLGIMPFAKLSKEHEQELFPVISKQSAFAEAVRGVRTSLMLGRTGTPPQVVLVTSALPGEGKSTLSASLAALLSQQGKRVLLVEVDMRHPTLRERLQLGGEGGLSSVLASKNTHDTGAAEMVAASEFPNLFVLPAGPTPNDPAELLDSIRMRDLVNVWRKQFDLIVLDGPPVLPVTDSIAIANMADTTVLVARCGYTPRTSLKRARQMLEEQVADARVRVVLNGVNPGSYAFDSFYGRSSDKYYGGEKYANA